MCSRVLAASFPICVLLFLLGVWMDSNRELNHLDAFAGDFAQTSAIDGISTTADNQILVELMPEDTTPANLFDLNGRTLVFTPDGEGGYSREVQPLTWEEHIGAVVADGAMIVLESFAFDFAGQSWDSFHVSRHGLLTFGGLLTYAPGNIGNRHATMDEIAEGFVDTPTISPLYKPLGTGTPHVARWTDRVVVTWITTDPTFYVNGVPPEKPARFQAVLRANGRIRFNYSDVALGDGIVGLFPDDEVVKGDLIVSVVDGTNPELSGHLDLLETAIYTSNTDAVILEFTTRDPIPEPDEGTIYSYRLHFDTDRPWWTFADFSDADFTWAIDITAGGEYPVGPGARGVLTSDSSNQVALLVDIHDLQGLSARVIADAVQFDNGSYVQNDFSSPTRIALPIVPPKVDLSQSGSESSWRQHEVFHYRSLPDLDGITCRVIDILGDRFDLFVFHSESRVDHQESGTPWLTYNRNTVRGIGQIRGDPTPCGEGRLKGRWVLPVWMHSDHVFDASPYQNAHTRFDRGLALFAHEFAHVWTAHASYDRNGKREPLFGNYCRCHWRLDLHLPAAFPWHEEETGPRSIMGGRYWRDNGDGTFTPQDGYWGGGFSWLDLYAMGLADASEVPDMFILRNLKAITEGHGEEGYWGGVFTGDKEIVSIDQVIAAEGPREPSAAESQKVFNAGFVYLLEPGKTPTADLLDLHAEYRDEVVEHWSHITGGRSQITTHVGGMVPPDPDFVSPVTLENPRAGSFQSGVGVISGWACEAEEIVIELDGRPLQAGYGTTREDTRSVCGDANNGFSLLWNWNNLGAGLHTVRALIDGQEFANTTVRVTTFGEDPFPQGWSGTFALPDFPTSGETTVVRWEESLQNFIITDGQPNTGGGYNRVAGVGAILENPSLGSAQSGVGVISGWACHANEIVIELNGVPLQAGYGTTREDTRSVCGDANNGFSLLWNWNNLRAGTHMVRALIDGQEFANTTVRVTTFGEDPFPQGLSGTFPIPDFPRPGENKWLQWEESLQNFVIIP